MTDAAGEDSVSAGADFPQYRRTADGRHAYRIMPDGFTEVQRVGSRFLIHEVVATAYPEMLRIHIMVTGDGGRYLPMTEAEWAALWAQAAGAK